MKPSASRSEPAGRGVHAEVPEEEEDLIEDDPPTTTSGAGGAQVAEGSSSSGGGGGPDEEGGGGCPICAMFTKGGCKTQFDVSGGWL